MIVVDTPGFSEGRLTAVPIRRLLDDPVFRDLIRADGGRVDWESVELAGLLTPPTATVPRTPAQLLRADAEIIDLHGRETLLTEFTDWCTSDFDSAVRLLVGPGGQGKTRFARALTARMRAHGWLAGLARPDSAGQVGRLATQTRPVLLVVDYAETRQDLTSAILSTLEARSSRVPVRLVLVARGGGDWWDDLSLRHALADDGQIIPLPAVEITGPDRTSLYTDAASTFGRRLTDLDPAVDWTERARQVESGIPGLSDPGYSLILAIHMAALTAILDQPGTSTDRSPAQVADRLLRHEKRYWTDTAHTRGIHRSAESLEQAIAAATLCGATNLAEATAILARVPSFAGDDGGSHDQRIRAARWLAGLYPPSSDQAGQLWGGISPDRLAEHFLACHLSSHTGDPKFAEQTIVGASTTQIYQALTVLNRAAPAHPELTALLATLLTGDPTTRAPIALRVAIEAADHRPTADALTTIAPRLDQPTLTAMIDSLPRYSLRLLDLAATLQHVHTTRTRHGAPHHPNLAAALNDLSVRLADLGRSEEALAAVEEAVAIRRRLAADRPDTFLPDLAVSLSNLANRLGDLREPEVALAINEEAVATYRRLVADRPIAFLPDLAAVLNNLAVQLGNLRRREEGLAAIEEAVAIRRRLAADRPDIFLPNLATSLNNLAAALGDLGRHDEALAAIEEAVAIRRRLAADRPDTFLPDLAISLNNLAIRLGDLRRREDALAAIQDAVATYRRLAADRPDTFLANLAGSLNNLTIDLGDLGRPEEALATIQEAVVAYRRLAADRPDAFLPNLATALNNLADLLRATGRHAEAKTIDHERGALSKVKNDQS
ncbi:tetratricopeptide repeat protein [Frankia sp. R82]|uniref:tetratricopeptide repeat protein n=1 Tax=Frankia sp. R82 TaxID=2950553 RepID=UPI0020441F37|nr:tetratricopeptide repeat protein [Frankia sp. R82]MCM3882225.1 tetratricopeptide repeat protein [Frankia sp. R82]